MTTLTAIQLGKTYHSKEIVKSVSLQISKGEVIGLLGPNGAGKTTCFYMILGIISPDTGTIHIAHQEITSLPIHQRAKLGIGYLPQEPSIFRKLTVEDNIRAILELQSELDAEAQETLLETLLTEFRIAHIRKLKGHHLSGGERRRVEIARALAARPKFILLDEPFAGIDPLSILDIKSLIRHLKDQGIGILITDHNVRDTLDICDRAYIMNHGEVIAEGNLQEILSNAKVRQVYLGEEFIL